MVVYLLAGLTVVGTYLTTRLVQFLLSRRSAYIGGLLPLKTEFVLDGGPGDGELLYLKVPRVVLESDSAFLSYVGEWYGNDFVYIYNKTYDSEGRPVLVHQE